MTEREDLRETLAANTPPPADPARRKADLSSAMSAFDAAAEENAAAHQGTEEQSRPKVRQSSLSDLWRYIMDIRLPSTRTLMLGSASVAVLAIAATATLNQDPGSVIPATPTQSPPAPVELRADSSVATSNETLADQSKVRREADQAVQAEPASPVVRRAIPAEEAARPKRQLELSEQGLTSSIAGELQQRGAQAPAAVPNQERARATFRPAPGAIVESESLIADDLPAPPQYKNQGRDRFEEIEPNPIKVTAEEPVSTFSIDVDTASYSFMRAALQNGVLPQKDSIRIEELINYFPYDYARPETREEPFATHVSVMPTPWNEGTKLMRIGIKGYELAPEEKPRSNLVFLLDTSGSMNAPNKLPLLKNSFRMLLDSLDPDDTVSIVVYAGSAGTVLEPTKVSEKSKILASLDRLRSGGSTAGGEGIRQAYQLAEANYDPEGVNRVILATDGDFNVGITNPEELKGFVERKRKTGVFLSVLGFGRGNYNDQLMQTLAQNGNGQAAYIDTLNEARKVLVEEAGSTLFPIAKDVKIQIEFNPATVAEYRLIGYETRLLNREDFNNDKIDAGEIGSGHRVTALYEITPAGSTARQVDALRYQTSQAPQGPENEYGFLKIRYKQPDASASQLITRPVTTADEGTADTDARFAAAVAGFGQLLRGGRHTGDFSYAGVIDLANGAKGPDPFGYRSEFVSLVRLAQSAAALEPQQR
ncbi:MAG: von Willebrand factor type A domain-containing protein [Pseudomonadota bacterium]